MNKTIEYLNNLDKKQLVMLYMCVVFLGYILFNAFISDMLDKQTSLRADIDAKQMKIMSNQPKRLKNQLQKQDRVLLINKDKLQEDTENINHLMSRLYQMKAVFFKEANLAKSLDLILEKSLKQNIQINFIKNSNDKVENLTELVQYKKSMNIDGNGKYKDIVQFIRFIEEQDLLMRLHDIKFEEDTKKQNVHFSLIIDFYGVGL